MKQATFVTLYLGIVSVVGVVGTAVGYGTVAYQLVEKTVISDAEYLAGSSRAWQIDACRENARTGQPVATTATGTPVPPTPAEIEECRTRETQKALVSRSYETKSAAVSGTVWGTVFFALFLLHFPFFVRRRSEEAK